ncbi:hypothetical protein CWR43_30780 [Rhizobium sullae]|uniref:Uncharacterized protein n=1 Tax=Rhizobium sullae TaxID=50338 RepID=A0A2N0D0L6_RHISU|nr:hypothetical protein [Rhizobium sullae]PKA39653.1 hypothetical protein CWR43_30780 [Rhizobium sullae]
MNSDWRVTGERTSNQVARAMEMTNAPLPVAYERATQAIAECSHIDECKSWSDKAAALASYARQADDKTLENYAMRIRSRAIQRAGELLKEFEPQKGGDRRSEEYQRAGAPPLVTRQQAANEAGMSPHQAKQAVRVANVPAEDFERQVESDAPPTITKLAKQGKKSVPQALKPRGFADATKLIGDLERLCAFLKDKRPKFIIGGMKKFEFADARLTAVSVCEWLQLFIDQSREHDLAAGQRATQKPHPPKSDAAAGLIGPIDRCAMQVRELIFNFVDETPPEQWVALIAELRGELDDIEEALQEAAAVGLPKAVP